MLIPASSIDELEDSWRYNLDTYALRVSNEKWIPYDWHLYLAERIADAVLAGSKRIIITAPPRHGKSELTSRWLVTWFLDNFPDRRVILASYASTLASDWSEKVRDTFNGNNPDTWARLNPDHSQRADWQLTAGGGMRAVGVGGGITGFGGDLILIDDPHKDWAEVQSATNRKKVIDWFNGTLYHRLEPDATIILIQTRWHERDLAGYLLKEHEDDWVEIRLPAIAEANDAMGRKPGEALCPQRYSAEALEKIKRAVGSHVFAGLFQQRPAPIEGGMVKKKWLKTWMEMPSRFDEIIQSWDLAFSGGPDSSFVVGQVWGSVGANKFLLDQVRAQLDFPETLSAFKSTTTKWPLARAKLVEEKANGAALIATLKDKIPGIIPVKPQGSKEARLASVSADFEAGNVYVPDTRIAPWVEDFVTELITFPGSANDDQVDACTQALSRFNGGGLSALRRLAKW